MVLDMCYASSKSRYDSLTFPFSLGREDGIKLFLFVRTPHSYLVVSVTSFCRRLLESIVSTSRAKSSGSSVWDVGSRS